MALKKRSRGGFSLVELLVASASATLLLGGLASALYLSGQALAPDSPTKRSADAARVLATLRDDLRTAVGFTMLTDSEAEFQVPDRDGDGAPETLRYAWAGTPGDPLVYEYTSSSDESDDESDDEQVLLESVRSFELTSITP